MQISFSAQQIATVLNGTVEGNPSVEVHDFSKIEEGKPGTLSFLANPKYTQYIYTTEASIVLVNQDFIADKPIKATLIRCENAYASLAKLFDIVQNSIPQKTGIEEMTYISKSSTLGNNIYVGSFAYIGDNSKIADNTKIYPQVYIGENVSIGKNTTIFAGAKIYSGTIIGDNCIIHAGSVIGSDGFGFAPEGSSYKKIPQLGNVIIEDDVEIGANTTIDRAVMNATIIRKGVKLDNLIQIAHNVEIGNNTVMAAQVGISGSTKIEENCMLGGQVGIGGHITIGNNSNIGAQSGIISNIKPNSNLMGSTAIPVKNYFRSSIIFAKLPDMYKEIAELKKEIESLKKPK